MERKLVLKCDEILWDKVKIFKINSKLESNNDAVLELIRRGLKVSS
jgi:hypothetical protein